MVLIIIKIFPKLKIETGRIVGKKNDSPRNKITLTLVYELSKKSKGN